MRLWHKDFGFVTMTADANNQWTNVLTGERWGSFNADFMSQYVCLPLDEVVTDWP